MVTLADVARRAGVSKSTASRALSDGRVSAATREHVLRIAAELHYVASPAAVSLATGRTGTIGAIVPAFDTWYTATLIRGIAHAALRHDFDLLLFELGEHGEHRDRAFDHFRRRRHVDAVFSANFALTRREVGALRDLGIPVGAIGGPTPGIRTWCLDDEAAGRLATQHLLGRGHRDILFAGGRPEEPLAMYVAEEARHAGYLSALRSAGLAPRPRRALLPTVAAAKEDAAAAFAADDRPRAVVAASDEIAMGYVLAAREAGLSVPADVSVVGVDDHPHAAAFDLTTVQQDPAEQGRLLIDWLAGEIDEPSGERQHTALAPVLVARGSVGPAPAA
ncbi:LacI family DNA-binding transcriptional regulator [Zhihengliuella alba]|uniref:LacI family DNA-binding transcriptional regulator n=1 Tax=Zhihengliuella alba TaxID=547018 RepID=A0ABP7DX00_9MICC